MQPLPLQQYEHATEIVEHIGHVESITQLFFYHGLVVIGGLLIGWLIIKLINELLAGDV